MKNIFSFLIFTMFLLSCTSKIEKDKPVREISLPKGAFRIGNAINGNWYKIEEINHQKQSVKISIFASRNAVRLVSKNFNLECLGDNHDDIENLQSKIESYDGTKIYLKSGCWLK
jgi:hypothetical protein